MAANNTIDESIALITAANTVVQNPDAVGTAFKTISMRIRGAKTELEEAGLETEGMVQSTAKLRQEILALSGVDIMEADGQTFKSTYDILDELAKKWQDLSDIQQATVTELIAGKRQGNIVSSLMTNFETAREALEVSLGSEGSALEEHSKYAESLEFRLNSLKASWQSFAQTFMNSDALKAGIGVLNKFVQALEWLIDKFGVLGTIGLGVFGKNLLSYFGILKSNRKTLVDVVNAVDNVTSAIQNKTTATQADTTATQADTTANIKNAESEVVETEATSASTAADVEETKVNALNAASEAQETNTNILAADSETKEAGANAVVTASEFEEIKANLAAVQAELEETKANLAAVQSELNEAKANAASTGSEAAETAGNLAAKTSESTSALSKFTSSLGGWAAIIGIVIAAISAIVQAIKNYKEKLSEARQETIEASNQFLIAASSFEQAYIKYSGKTNLTVEEEQELESAIKGTTDALGNKSDALKNVVSSSNDYVASLEAIADAELKAASRAALDKKNNAQIELEDVAQNWIGASKVDVNVYDNRVGTVNKKLAEKQKVLEYAADSLDSVFLQKQNTGNRFSEKNIDYVNFELSKNADLNEIIDYYYTLVEYKAKLDEVADTQPDILELPSYSDVTEAIEEMSGAIEAYESGIYDAAKAQYQLSNGIPKTTEEFLEMREAILRSGDIKDLSLDAKSSIANTLDSEYGQIFDLSSAEVQAKRFIGLIEGYGDETKDGINEVGTVETFLNMRTMVNSNDVSVGEYLAQFDEINKMTSEWSDKEKELLNTSLGIDSDAIKQQYEDTFDYLSRLYKNQDTRKMDRDEEYNYKFIARENDKKVKEFLDSLTAEELAAVVSLRAEIDWENTSEEEINKQIEERVKLNEALSFDADIEVDTTALETLNGILAESASAIGLSEESIDSLKSKYKDLDNFNPHTLFEETANGIKVNRDELVKLEKEYNDLTKAKVKEHLDSLVDAYNDVTAEIDKCTNAGERANLLSKRETYASQIEELATYQAQLEGVTGAYQRWLDAQNNPESYEGYEGVAASKSDVQDEIDRGFIGNATKEYIDLLSGKDLTGGTIDDYATAWDELDKKVTSTGYSVKDFFTVNDDGDITATGIHRFFDGIKNDIEGIYNADTGVYDFSEDNLKKIQDEYGMGIEAIELLLEAAASAGYEVDWGGIFDNIDLDTSNFESLVSVAENAQKELNKLEGYEDLKFNFTTTNVESATLELEKAQNAYNELVTDDDGNIDVNAKGANNARVILATLLVQKQQLEDSEIAINISTSGLDESQAKAVAWVQDFREKYKNLEIAISTGEGIEEAKSELETVKTSLGELDGDTAKIAGQLVLGERTDASGDGFKTQVNNAIDSIGSQDINVGFKLNETALSDLNSNLLTNFTVNATAKITNVDESQLETVETGGMVTWTENVDGVTKSFEADGIVYWDDNIKSLESSFSANGTVTWTSGNNVSVKVISEADGTANADGTASGRAFRHGDWGIKGSGTALVGELGMETLVRGGRFYTIGDNGAEFIKYRQGDIIFNHKQTEGLFKSGKVTSNGGRGKMFADGSAFADGSSSFSGRAFWQTSSSVSNFAKENLLKDYYFTKKPLENTQKSTSSKKSDSSNTISAKVSESKALENLKNGNNSTHTSTGSSSSSSEKNEFEETIDWIETKISRLERAIDHLDKTTNNVYKSWSDRNSSLVEEIGQVGDEIELQQSAYNRYMQEANSVGLDESWATKVRNGEIDIETITDEALKEKIDDYRNWYDKALACEDAILELKETEAELYAQRFENIQTQYDGILQGYEHTEAMLNEYISQAEEQGYIVSKKYYDALIVNEKSNIAELKKEQADLIAARDEAVESGTITRYSEEWYNMCSEIDATTQAIEEGSTAILEYARAIEEIDWSIFDLIQERISAVSEEADFLIELMSNKKLFDDDGKLTSQGLATMGLHAQNVNAHMYQADEYGAEVTKLNKQIANDPYDQELINRRNELLELQRESILAAEDEKNAIRDMVEEGINLELDALQERIDKYNESIDAAKDLYDYQKNVQEQSEEIASLEKQRAAYLGNDSEEGKAKLQEIEVSLKEAKEDLQETEYDKYISDQQALLDTLYTEYELILNQRLDNVDYLLESVIESINAAASADGNIATALGSEGAIAIAVSSNATSIKDTLTSETSKVGTTLSNAMNSIWNTGDGNAKSVLTMYGEDFRTKSTTIITTLNGIKSSVNSMVTSLNKEAEKKVTANKTTTSAKKNPTTTTTSKKSTTTTKKKTSSGDGKPKIGDKVTFVSGQYYYDSQGKKPLGSKYKGKQVYITNINTKDWATHGYHISTGKKLGQGDLGWLKLNQLSGYAVGKHNFLDDEIAWTQENGREFIVRPSDGAILTPVAKGDSVLNATASNNIWDFANNPAEFIKDNLGISSASVPNNSNVNNSVVQNFENITFSMPNVHGYNELLTEMQHDPKFEKLILAMTVNQIAGKSKLAKNKSIR